MSKIGPSLTNKLPSGHSNLERMKRQKKDQLQSSDKPCLKPNLEELRGFHEDSKDHQEVLAKLTLFCRLQKEIRPSQHYWLSNQKHMTAEHREALILWLVSLSTADASMSQQFPLMETVVLFDRVLCHASFRHLPSAEFQPLLIACFTTVVSKLSGAITSLKKLQDPEVQTPGSGEIVAQIEQFTRRIGLEVKGTSRSYLICSHATVLQLLGLYFRLKDEEVFFARMLLEAALLNFSSLRYSQVCLTLTVVTLVIQLTKAVDWKGVLPSFEAFVSKADFVRCAKNLVNPMLRQQIPAPIRKKFQLREWLMVGYWTVVGGDQEDTEEPDLRRSKSYNAA